LRRPPRPAEGQERHPLFYAKVPPPPPHEEDQQGTGAAVLFPEARRHLEPHHQDRVPPVAPALWVREGSQRQAALFLLRDARKECGLESETEARVPPNEILTPEDESGKRKIHTELEKISTQSRRTCAPGTRPPIWAPGGKARFPSSKAAPRR